MPRGKGKETVKAVMHDWKAGDLHSGSKHGPKVTSKAQAVAIALSEAREKPDQPAHKGKKHPSGPLARLFGR